MPSFSPVPRLPVPLQRFARRTDGAVAMIFALALIPMTLMIGAAIDYYRASDVKAFLSATADAAALAAVTPNAMGLGPGKAKNEALDFFNARAGTLKTAINIKPTIKVEDDKGQRKATITFTAEVPTTFWKLAGRDSVVVGETAVASSSLPLYIDFYLLLDNTPSMGVAATPADIDTMVKNTPDQCAFACHDLSAGGNDRYALAKSLNVTMRIDVVRQATQKLMDTAAAMAQLPGQFRMAINTFGSACNGSGLTTVSTISSNLTAAKSSANAIDLMTIPYQNFNNDQCTDFDGAFATMNTLIPAAGDGFTAANPQKVMFFVSDGVADAYYPVTCSKPTTGGRCQEPIKSADCKALKDRGVKIAVLYTTYLPLPTNGWYNTWIAPFAGSIGNQMQACASSDLYFEVSPSGGIAEAMEQLFKKAISQARLSV